MNNICDDPYFCSTFNRKVNFTCNTCIKRLSLDRDINSPFTPEEEKEILKFLDENRDFMQDLIKRGD